MEANPGTTPFTLREEKMGTKSELSPNERIQSYIMKHWVPLGYESPENNAGARFFFTFTKEGRKLIKVSFEEAKTRLTLETPQGETKEGGQITQISAGNLPSASSPATKPQRQGQECYTGAPIPGWLLQR